MSDFSDSGLNLEDLELQLLPAWAKQAAGANRYAGFEGAPEGGFDRRRDRRRPPGRPGDRPQGNRPPGDGPRRRDDRGRPSRGPGGARGGRPEWESRPAPPPLPDLGVSLIPEAKGVESLARQVRLTGRAYPVFEIAQLILRKPERYEVRFDTVKKGEQVAQQLWLCNLDDTLWLSEADAVGHVIQRHFGTFYQAEKTPTNPPKGTYTFVAQCGLSGTILGPPNFHDYQAKLLRLHASRFSRMPFEAYKAKVRIVRDEATVKKWIEDQSFKTEFVTLNVPEPIRLVTMEEVEKHFREVHLANIIQSVDHWSVLGPAAQNLPALPLRQLVRQTWEEQRRFPLRVVGVLSQQLASHGLQFFKVNKTVTHVAVARPHFLDVALTPVSDGIRRIVEFIDGHAGCTRRQLMEALAPAPRPAPAPAPAAAPVVPVTPVEAQPSSEAAPAETVPPPAPVADAPPPPTPEQTAVTSDLHWLIHQGHVIEFANGRLETAKKPKPKPVRPEKPAGESAREPAAEETTTGVEAEAPPGAEGKAAEPVAADVPKLDSEVPSATSDKPSAQAEAEVEAAPAAAPLQDSGTASESGPVTEPVPAEPAAHAPVEEPRPAPAPDEPLKPEPSEDEPSEDQPKA
jgi:hypothetical protein